MKKRLEAELISIAHRVLKLKNKSEIDQLYLETRKLYETLAVLKFYGDNYEQLKAEISKEDFEEKIESSFKNNIVVETSKVVIEEVAEIVEGTLAQEEPIVVSEEIEETKTTSEKEIEEEPIIVSEISIEEKIEEDDEEEIFANEAKSDLDFEPIFELAEDSNDSQQEMQTPVETAEIVDPKKETQQISFEDLLGQNYTEPIFVKPNDVTFPTSKTAVFEKSDDIIVDRFEGKSPSLNDKLSKTITIGLNDRMGFVKFLFADSNEDYNRVLSQLNTFSTFIEAKDFIDEIIKPDYNNWKGKEDYEAQFIEIVAKKFL